MENISNLIFELNSSGKSYTLKGVTEVTSYMLDIPSTYNGLPVTRIGYGAFDSKPYQEVYIPDSVIEIGDLAFFMCTELNYVHLGNSVYSIGESAFFGCSQLNGIILPDSLGRLDGSAFDSSGIDMYMGLENSQYLYVLDGDIYSYEDNVLVAVNKQETGDYDVKNFVKEIGPRAFSFSKYEYVTIPKGVEIISFGAFDNSEVMDVVLPNTIKEINANAFSNCYTLSEISYHGLKEQWEEIDIDDDWLEDTNHEITVSCLDGDLYY